VIDAEVKEPGVAIDRSELLCMILCKEHEFQYAKIGLIENFMEAYEHTIDLVEQQRLIQIIVDVMSKRPRLNFSENPLMGSTILMGAYDLEIENYRTKAKLVRKIIDY
jgi:hypothetical protein